MIVKSLVIVLLSGLAACASEYRDFMDTQGRTIRGKIISFDARADKIKMERDNGKVATVPVSIFSAEDQEYIKTWLKFEGVRSLSSFKIAVNRKGIKSWSHERLGTISYSDGSSENNQVVGKTDFDEIAYELTLDNRNKYALSNLTLEYNIYYEQDIRESSKEPGQFVRVGKIALKEMGAQSKLSERSESIVIFKDESNSEFLNSRVLKGKVEGIVWRIYAQDGDGRILLRNESMPKSLAESKAWLESSKIAPLPPTD